MSRPGNCWLCGVDPSAWWLHQAHADTQDERRVWCQRCHDLALSFFAAIVNTGDMQTVVMVLESHVARDVVRQIEISQRGLE